MNVGALLEPLVVKAIAAKGYTRQEAVHRSWVWLAGQLGVSVEALKTLDYEQEWQAHAAVEKALLPPLKNKAKLKYDPPRLIEEAAPSYPDAEPWEDVERDLLRLWGKQFFEAFFGEHIEVKVEGLVAAGQYAPEAIRQASMMGLLDA